MIDKMNECYEELVISSVSTVIVEGGGKIPVISVLYCSSQNERRAA